MNGMINTALPQTEEIDKPRSNCGVVGVYGATNASTLTYYGLHALQHRGQEASGIVSCTRSEEGQPASKLRIHRGPGLLTEVFDNPEVLHKLLVGDVAIGHNRYSTTGTAVPQWEPFVPISDTYRANDFAVAQGAVTLIGCSEFDADTDSMIEELEQYSDALQLNEEMRKGLRKYIHAVRGAIRAQVPVNPHTHAESVAILDDNGVCHLPS